ncbi:MAG: formylglycine-generating enzyme family protein [Parahaliea sp.]
MKSRKSFATALLLSALCTPLAHSDEYYSGQTFAEKLNSGGEGPQMMVVPRGKFVLGGGKAGPDNAGVITIDYPIALGLKETTRAQYRQFLTATQSSTLRTFPADGDTLPVTGVSWDDAEAYTTWLSRETGHHYRLPSASEWEYAARGGTALLYSWGDQLGRGNANCANCGSNYDGATAPVGSFKANNWGFFDMEGNAWEWTKDCIDSNSAPPSNGMPQLFGDCDLRELRGGSAKSDGWSIRLSARASAPRKTHMDDVGFRVVREIAAD